MVITSDWPRRQLQNTGTLTEFCLKNIDQFPNKIAYVDDAGMSRQICRMDLQKTLLSTKMLSSRQKCSVKVT